MATTNFERLYGTSTPQDVPRYSVTDAARYLTVPAATVRSWIAGTSYSGGYFQPVIQEKGSEVVSPLRLSFNNLIEVHVLRALRTQHGINLRHIRRAIAVAEEQCGVDRLLLRPELRTDGVNILLDEFGRLTDLTKSGQLGMRQILKAHLKRVEWSMSFGGVRLYPFVRAYETTKRIAIDPTISFGKPVIVDRGISTAVIAKRLDSGETRESVAADYDLALEDVDIAAVYEIAA